MRKKTIYMLFCLLALWGCSQESDFLSVQGEKIVLNSRIDNVSAGLSRAPIENTHASVLNVAFARIDQTGNTTWETWSANAKLVKGKRAAVNGVAVINFTTDQYYSNQKDASEKGYGSKFIGWHPDVASSGDKVTFSIDGKTDVMWTSSLLGSHSDKFNSTNKVFSFAHQLSRITVKAYGDAPAATYWGTITSITVSATPVSCTMTLAEPPTVSWGASTGSIKLKKISDDSDVSGASIPLTTAINEGTAIECGYAMLAPASSYQLEVTTSNAGLRRVTVSNTFLASNHYTVYLSFQSNTIAPYGTIDAWSTGSGTPTGGFPNVE